MALTVFPELLLDSPCAEDWEKADLHWLRFAFLWLLYVPVMNYSFAYSWAWKLADLGQLSGVPWPQTIHHYWAAVSSLGSQQQLARHLEWQL